MSWFAVAFLSLSRALPPNADAPIPRQHHGVSSHQRADEIFSARLRLEADLRLSRAQANRFPNPRPATVSPNATATRSTSAPQAPGSGRRNSRGVGCRRCPADRRWGGNRPWKVLVLNVGGNESVRYPNSPKLCQYRPQTISIVARCTFVTSLPIATMTEERGNNEYYHTRHSKPLVRDQPAPGHS